MKVLHDTVHTRKVGSDKKFSAGCSRFQLVDANRRELFDLSTHRQFEVMVWYPGERNAGQSPKKYPPFSGSNPRNWVNRFMRIDKHIIDQNTRTFEGIPLSDEKTTYPVLLFSHDIGKLPEYYTELMEELAEEGYFIFCINHPYLSLQSTLGNHSQGKTIHFKKRSLLVDWMLQREIKSILETDNYESRWELGKRRSFAKRQAGEYVAEWCWDKKFLLNYLEALTTPKSYNPVADHNFFAGRIDFSQVAVLGHGWGGSSSVHSLLSDKRVKAAINMNGFQFSEGMENRIMKPLLMLYSEDRSGMNDGIYFSPLDYTKVTLLHSTDHHFSDCVYTTGSTEQDVLNVGEGVLEEKIRVILSFLEENLRAPYRINLKTRQVL